jgi:anoctamin-7
LDAQKFICETRRAVAERAENIGIWCKILDMLAQFAVITNVRFTGLLNMVWLTMAL